MRIISVFFLLILLISCNFSKQKLPDLSNEEKSKKESKYLYNINIDSLRVINQTVRKGESVGKILNQHNVSFANIDTLCRAGFIVDVSNMISVFVFVGITLL